MIKVIHIIPSLRKGGAERLVLDILREFRSRKNIKIKLVVFRNEIDYLIDDIVEHIKIIPSSVSLSIKKKNIFQINELQNFIEEFEPNIIHTHLFEAELVSRFCYFPKAKWFSHLHDNMVQLYNFSVKSISNKQALTNYYEKTVLFKNYQKNGGTNFIAISSHSKKYIKSVQSKYPVTLLHNAINVKRFQRRLSETEGYTAISPLNLSTKGGPQPLIYRPKVDLGLNPQSQPSVSTLTLINIGSFNENKNQSFLLDIIIELNKLNQRVNCIFLGDGTLKKEVEEKSKELKIYDQCQFMGMVENVEEYLWKSDIYVHTALSEALGLTILEAMAAGLPIVSLDGGGNKDIIENGKNGFILKKQDPKLFAEKILEVRYNEKMKKYNGEFAQQFDIENYTVKLLKRYKIAIDSKNSEVQISEF